ncbi:unnamed protein product [Fraxinus pennsylvanica]|uniref:Uncharacterized protein n=1 Tax=Fraxinus pennsylvanica TaxID=56036 RepID=A0AAD2E9U2_9LAMI|nr:unnamed protein product [Fraxinus pennsylvanica]
MSNQSSKRYAVVTGANKGIGFELCRQLACKGVMVVLTARDEKRGNEALEKLKGFGLSENVVFHQLDVMDQTSIASLAHFIKNTYGKLDILVNNAGISGISVEGDVLAFKEIIEAVGEPKHITANGRLVQTYEWTEQCLQTNYYDTPVIVNVSSLIGQLKFQSNEWAKQVLSNAEELTEDKVDNVLNKFLQDFKENSLKVNGWPEHLSAYRLSKSAIIAYTRIMAKKHPNFYINCVCPGYVKTDINANTGPLTVEEGADSLLKLALLADWGAAPPSVSQSTTFRIGTLAVVIGRTPVEPNLNNQVLSDTPVIVNVSSLMGQLTFQTNEWAKQVLSNAEELTEDKVDNVLNKFLQDFKENSLKVNGWPEHLPAYRLSKSAINAYTRIMAKKYPDFYINCVCPGYVKTDININTGPLTVEEGADSLLKLALLPDGGATPPSGLFFFRQNVSAF